MRLNDQGMPTGFLEHRSDRLVLVPNGLPSEMINPRSKQLHRLGIYSFGVRGVGYHEHAVRGGDFRPGRPVRLVREPDNEHDTNAIAASKPPHQTRDETATLGREPNRIARWSALHPQCAGSRAAGARWLPWTPLGMHP